MSTVLSILVIALPVVASVVPFFMPEKAESPAMHKRWRIGFVIFAVLYSCLVGFWQYRTTAEDELEKKDAVIQNSGEVRKIVKEEDHAMVTALNTAISSLSNLVSTQQQQINDIHNSNFVTGKKPVQVQISNPQSLAPQAAPEIHVSSMPVTPDPRNGKAATQFILTTNKVMEGGRVRVQCTKVIKQGNAQISGIGYVTQSGGGLMDDHTWESGIASPNWSPNFPLVITLYSDADLGRCSFKPLS